MQTPKNLSKGLMHFRGLHFQTLLALCLVLMSATLVSAQTTPVTPSTGAISAGSYHVLSLKSDGSVWAWGMNNFGEIGDGTAVTRYAPVQVTSLGNSIAAVSGGGYHSLALGTNGTVWAWGYNTYGELGDGTTTQRNIPVQVGGSHSTFIAVAAGQFHSIALGNDGTVWTWGYNGYGQLGNNSTTNSSVPIQVPGLSGVFIAIAAGPNHSMALRNDGTVWTWGLNSNGQLGNGTTSNSAVPVQVANLNGVTSIAAGGIHSLAITSGSGVWGWGYNGSGQLGDGTYTQRNTPVHIAALTGTVTSIGAGQYHSVAAKSDGTVWTWGYNGYGQLGSGTASSILPIQTVGINGGIAVSAGYYSTYALKNDGSVLSWGLNSSGQIGDGFNQNQANPGQVLNLGGIEAVAGSGYHTLAIKNDGTLWSWGHNAFGQLGDGSSFTRSAPVKVTGSFLSGNVLWAVAGGYHSLALKSDGTFWDWGYNYYGELGDGTNNQQNSPHQIPALNGLITSGACGLYHSIILENDGTVWTFGSNSNGQLGNGSTSNSNVPIQLTGTGFQLGGVFNAVAAGQLTSFAIRNDGTVWAWGQNNYGQLGDGTTIQRTSPVQVTGLSGTVTEIASGNYHTLALKSNGTVWAWGYNVFGQLGNGITSNSSVPVPVNGLTGIVAIAAGQYHSIALKNDNTVWVWGLNGNGQLGDGTYTSRSLPERLSNLCSVSDIAAGVNNTVVLKQDGTVSTFGATPDGELGNNIGGNRFGAGPVYGLNLIGGVMPTISITSPLNGSVGGINQPISLQIATNGPISKVDYYLDGNNVVSGTNGSFSLSYTPTTWGSFNFTAIATDANGLTSPRLSAVTVNNPPPITTLYGPLQIQWNGVILNYNPIASAVSANNPQGSDVYTDPLGSPLCIWLESNSSVILYKADGTQVSGTYSFINFQFNFNGQSVGTIAGLDSNGLSTTWELTYFGQLGINPNALAPRGDGLTNLQASQQGLDPIDFYNGVAPTLTILGGNNQNGVPNIDLAQPFSLLVSSASGTPLINAPVTVTIPLGGGLISLASAGTTGSAALSLRTDQKGQINLFYQEGPAWGVNSKIATIAGKSLGIFTATVSPQVGHWTFNNHTGNTTPDSSNTGNIGNLIGGVTWGNGFDGSPAIILDGSSGYMEAPASPTMALGGGPISVTTWVQMPMILPLDNETEIYPLITLGSGTTDALSLRLRGGGHGLEALVNTVNGSVQIDAPLNQPLPLAGTWHQVGFINDVNGNASLVIDGRIAAVQSGVQIAPVAAPRLWVGRDSAGNYLGTSIDEIELRRDALGVSDVLARFNVDNNQDGVPDWWEYKYFSTIYVNLNALAASGNGLTNLQSYQQGVSPTDYYNGVIPTITKLTGDHQNALPNTFLPQSLTVLVTDPNGKPIVNSPVNFNVTAGRGTLTSSTSVAGSSSVSLRTGSNGQASLYYQESSVLNLSSQIAVTAGLGNCTFNETASPLVAQWMFNDGSGLIAADSSNTGNPCTLNGGVTWTSGFDGNGAVTLDGSTGFLAPAPSSTLSLFGSRSGFSMGTWISIPANTPLDSSNQIYPIITVGDASADYFSLVVRGGGHGVEVQMTSGTITSVIDGPISPSVIADGGWHYLGFSYDGLENVLITLDGQELAFSSWVILSTLNSPRIWLGQDLAGHHFKGTLNQFTIQQAGLTEANFGSNYAASRFTSTQTIHGSDFTTFSDQWTRDGLGVIDTGYRGSISYKFNVPSAGIWAFELATHSVGGLANHNVTIPFDVLIDGVLIGHYNSLAYNGEANLITGLTQNLNAGSHTLQIVDWNPSAIVDLEIDSLTILKPSGPSSLNGGQPDWLTQKLALSNTVNQLPSSSYVSPICIEGTADFPGLIAITSGTQTQSFKALGVVMNGPWYSNVPLNADGSATPIATQFEGGIVSTTSTTNWTAFNVFTNTQTPLIIRKGDSLRLTGYPNQATGPVQISIMNGQNLVLSSTTTADAPLVYTFAQTGTYTVQTTWNGTATASAIVQVKTASFGDLLYGYLNNPLQWNLPNVGTDLTLQWDPNLSVTENTPPSTGGRSFQILPLATGTLYAVARLYPGGPIIASGGVESSNLYDANATGDSHVIGTGSNGVPLVENDIAINMLPPGGYVVVQIQIAGATFADGTTRKVLTEADFRNGIATFVVAWANTHSDCHNVHIYNAKGVLVGQML